MVLLQLPKKLELFVPTRFSNLFVNGTLLDLDLHFREPLEDLAQPLFAVLHCYPNILQFDRYLEQIAPVVKPFPQDIDIGNRACCLCRVESPDSIRRSPDVCTALSKAMVAALSRSVPGPPGGLPASAFEPSSGRRPALPSVKPDGAVAIAFVGVGL